MIWLPQSELSLRTSLVAQWVRLPQLTSGFSQMGEETAIIFVSNLQAPKAGGPGSIHGRGTRSRMHAKIKTWRSLNKERNIKKKKRKEKKELTLYN